MKVTVNRAIEGNRYPCLKINDHNKVVLFLAPSEGVVVFAEKGDDPTGYHSQYWQEKNFEPFHGSVTLEN